MYEEVERPSESEASVKAKGKVQEIVLSELWKAASEAYHDVPAVMNIPLMQEVGSVMEQ